MSFYNLSPFHLINDMAQIPFGGDVYVISDAKYAELRQKQAADEIGFPGKPNIAFCFIFFVLLLYLSDSCIAL